MEIVIIFLLFWFMFGFVGWRIMSNKGRSGVGGLFLGLFLGLIGLLIALVLKPSLEHQAREQKAIREILRDD